MLSLLLLRHAKSGSGNIGIDDFDRSLNARGLEDAQAAGSWMAENRFSPDLIVCSGARRARETLDLVLPCLRGDREIRLEDRLYRANGAEELLDRLKAVGKGPRKILLIGHNPAIWELALLLSGQGDPADLERLQTRFSAAAMAKIHFEAADWSHIAAADGILANFVPP